MLLVSRDGASPDRCGERFDRHMAREDLQAVPRQERGGPSGAPEQRGEKRIARLVRVMQPAWELGSGSMGRGRVYVIQREAAAAMAGPWPSPAVASSSSRTSEPPGSGQSRLSRARSTSRVRPPAPR